MRILVTGADGYIGFPLSMHLATRGFDVVGVDNYLRRKWVAEVGSHSATPIRSMMERWSAFERIFGKKISFEYGDLTNYGFVQYVLDKYKPETVIYLGQQASAPFSMIDVDHAVLTQMNNLVGTLNILHAIHEVVPCCHLIKLGSMGEYGSPNVDIPEGFFEVEYKGRKDTLLFPRQAFDDWYHWSKVYDSDNILMACRVWNLSATDIMQGVVYGTRTDEIVDEALLTRFDFDAVFGTAINRFCAQAVLGHILTPYGTGGQKRPVISLRDTIQCFVLAVDNQPLEGEYRVFNQFDEIYSIGGMAQMVMAVGKKLGFDTKIENIENPRVEDEQVHYYNPIHEKLYKLGFVATHRLEYELESMLTDLGKYRDRIVEKEEYILPTVYWREPAIL